MNRFTKYILNSLIVAYLSIIYFTGVPESNTLNSRLKQKLHKVAQVVGIWPSWSMFAPNPIRFDSKTYVEITYSDGEILEEDVEKNVDGVLGAFRKARWMKYSQDNLRNPRHKVLLKPALHYFAKKFQREGNPIVNITLKRKWAEIQPFSDQSLHPIKNTPRTLKNEILISSNLER